MQQQAWQILFPKSKSSNGTTPSLIPAEKPGTRKRKDPPLQTEETNEANEVKVNANPLEKELLERKAKWLETNFESSQKVQKKSANLDTSDGATMHFFWNKEGGYKTLANIIRAIAPECDIRITNRERKIIYQTFIEYYGNKHFRYEKISDYINASLSLYK